MKKSMIGKVISALVLMSVSVSSMGGAVGFSSYDMANADEHVKALMYDSNAVYEVKKGWMIDSKRDMEAATARASQIDGNEIKCNFNNNKEEDVKDVKVGERLAVKGVKYKIIPTGFLYQVDVMAYDSHNVAKANYPIAGLICTSKQRIVNFDDILVSGTGGGPIVKNESLYVVNKGIYRKPTADVNEAQVATTAHKI